MGFTLERIVPWGGSHDEYVAMFELGAAEREYRLLGCGDGPAAFNAGWTQRGGRVVSLDPLYAFDAAQIAGRIAATRDTVLAELRRNRADYRWQQVPTVEALGQLRQRAMDDFLADLPAGRRAGRYVAGALPDLPFAVASFDLALSSHFLFLYAAQLPLEFHLAALRDMLRVAREVRVFPLLALDGRPSPHLPAVIAAFSGAPWQLEIRPVAYEFQKGGNRMLRIARTA